MELLYQQELGWNRRPIFGALHLRPPAAQHTRSEAELLMHYATDARTIVELGVAEGGSAAELRSVMSYDGTLFLVDPFEPPPRAMRFVAKRAVRSVRRGRVQWIRLRSDDAVVGWDRPIDFLFIDADHSYDRAASDWRNWSPHVRPGGYVALHDSAFCDRIPEEWGLVGPLRVLAEIRANEPDWTLVGQTDSMSVLQRPLRQEV